MDIRLRMFVRTGLGLRNPIKHASEEFFASMKVTRSLKNLVTEEVPEIPFESWKEQKNAKSEISRTRCCTEDEIAKQLKSSLPTALQHSMTLAQEREL